METNLDRMIMLAQQGARAKAKGDTARLNSIWTTAIKEIGSQWSGAIKERGRRAEREEVRGETKAERKKDRAWQKKTYEETLDLQKKRRIADLNIKFATIEMGLFQSLQNNYAKREQFLFQTGFRIGSPEFQALEKWKKSQEKSISGFMGKYRRGAAPDIWKMKLPPLVKMSTKKPTTKPPKDLSSRIKMQEVSVKKREERIVEEERKEKAFSDLPSFEQKRQIKEVKRKELTSVRQNRLFKTISKIKFELNKLATKVEKERHPSLRKYILSRLKKYNKGYKMLSRRAERLPSLFKTIKDYKFQDEIETIDNWASNLLEKVQEHQTKLLAGA